MKKIITATLLFSTLIFTGWSKAKKTELTILAAASLTDVCAELKTEYEKMNPDVKLFFSFGGSGALQAQIEAGAPCDLFISAATKQMKALVEKDLMDNESVKNLLENKVVLILPAKDGSKEGKQISSFEELTSPSVKMIAIGEPSSVPVGQYTQKIFAYYGLDEAELASASVISYGSNVKEVTAQVGEGAVDCGVIYSTDAYSAGLKTVDEATKDMCGQVIYPAAVLKGSQNKDAAQEFLNYLKSDDSKKVFEKIGFTCIQ